MEKLKLVDKLRAKTNISYEEAKSALEKNKWDILDAMVYLEHEGRIKKPSVSEFYTNDYKTTSSTKGGEVMKIREDKGSNNFKGKNDFEGVFEGICKVIDSCNNIFLTIKRRSKIIIRLPLTVVILLLFFAFWVIIPLMIIGLFFEMEFSVDAMKFNSVKLDKINEVFSELSKVAQDIIEKFKKGFKNG